MSDDLVKSMEDDLRIGCSASIGDTQKAVATIKEQAAEIARLRAELATATQWRNAINDALTSWHNPIDEEETPKEAIDRLIGYETAIERFNALDPAVSQSAADLVATTRQKGMEEAAQIVKEIWEKFVKSLPCDVGISLTLDGEGIYVDGVDIPKGPTYETAIRAAAKEGKP